MSATHLRQLVAATLAALPALSSNAPAASVEAYATVEAGFANTCLLSSLFLPGGHPFAGTLGVPAQGATFQDCGFSMNSGASNPSSATGTVNATWTASASDNSGYSFTGSAAGRAAYGVFGAQASAKISSPFYTGGSLGNAAAAYGVMNDVLDITSPSHAAGTAGFIVFTFSVDGSLNAGTAAQVANGANALIGVRLGTQEVAPFSAIALGGDQGTVNPSHLSGFTMGVGTVSGSGSVSPGDLEFFFGVPTEFQAGLYAGVRPSTAATGGSGEATVSFMSTARITGIQVLDGAMNPISDFTITAESGALYTANGLVPEPRTVVSLSIGLLIVASILKRLRRDATASRAGSHERVRRA